MAITTTISRITYDGDDSTVIFPFQFKIFAESDLYVYLVDVAGNQVLQTLNSDYTVSGVDDDSGGTVTFITAPMSAYSVLIVRTIPKTRITDFSNNGIFDVDVLNHDLDKAVAMCQDLQDASNRSFKASANSPLTTDLTVDLSSTGGFLRVKNDGSGVETATITAGDITQAESIAQLRSFTPVDNNTKIDLLGYYAAGDNKTNQYVYISTLMTSDNGGSVIRPDSIAESDPGRWYCANANNVKDFGAVAGVDATASFQAMYDALGFIYFDSEYKVGTINVSDGARITGVGDLSIIKPFSGSISIFNVIDSVPAGTAPRNLFFDNFVVDGTEFAKTCTLISGTRLSVSTIKNIKSVGMYATQNITDNTYLMSYSDIFMSECVYGIKPPTYGTSNILTRCTVEYTEHGWNWSQMRYSSMIACTCDHLYKGVYAYDFDRCEMSLIDCGCEVAWGGASSEYGSGLITASGTDCAITIHGGFYTGGNSGAENTDITISDLGLTNNIVCVSDASLTVINASFRSFVNRDNSTLHLPFEASTGSHVKVIENGTYSDYSGTYYARVTDWIVSDDGNLDIDTTLLKRQYLSGVKISDISPKQENLNHWLTLGYVSIDSLSIPNGRYKVNTAAGSTGTFPSGNSGSGIYDLSISPDSTTGYAIYIDNNGLIAKRNLISSVWGSWIIISGISSNPSVNIDTLFNDGVYRVNTSSGTTGTLPSGNSGFGIIISRGNGAMAIQEYFDANGTRKYRISVSSSYGSWL